MKTTVVAAIRAGLPIFVGYAPAAAAFGILAKNCSLSLTESVLFSALVFAGASQFIALNLLATGTGPLGIVVTTLLVNFRHFLMSGYLATRVGQFSRKYHSLMAFGVTDEVFSVLAMTREPLTRPFILTLQLTAYSAWVGGTLAGYVLGSFLPPTLTQSMGVALYALLLAILLPELKRSRKAVMLAVSSGLLHTLLSWLDVLPQGWSVIVCILVVAGFGALMPQRKTRENSDV